MFIDLPSAVSILRNGGIVAFPTETIYGIGANAFDPDAVAKIYTAKGRPSSNPLIVHIASLNDLHTVAGEVDPLSQRLMDAFWPGPLTLILPKHANIPSETVGGLNTVAVRMPDHALAQELIRTCSFPIAAPSANPSGKPSATHHDHVAAYFGDAVPCIEGGTTDKGIESTVVMVRDNTPHILRLGSITPDDIKNMTGINPVLETTSKHSPGTNFKHYAPNAKVLIVEQEKIADTIRDLESSGKKVGVIDASRDLESIAHTLYDDLLRFDADNVDVIVAPHFPNHGLGLALNDRLERAAKG